MSTKGKRRAEARSTGRRPLVVGTHRSTRVRASAYANRLAFKLANPIPPEGYVYCPECAKLVRLRASDGKPSQHQAESGITCSAGVASPVTARSAGNPHGEFVCQVVLPSGRKCLENYASIGRLRAHQTKIHGARLD